VKACCYYNDLVKKFGLQKSIEPIHSGTKIKWVYMRENQYNIDCLAFKADGTDPDRIMEIINTYVDKVSLYEHELKGKLEDFYNVFTWQLPSSAAVKAAKFFD
jgi:hypothetical protein